MGSLSGAAPETARTKAAALPGDNVCPQSKILLLKSHLHFDCSFI